MKVKICGVTRPDDALLAAELGADLVGINFWPGSARGVGLQRAREVAAAVARRALLVGVFVDQDPALIDEAIDAAGLDLVQLHGDEDPRVIARTRRPLIKAFRIADAFDPAAAVAPWAESWGWLFDASQAGIYGGTGVEWPWRRVADLVAGRPLLVAGGIGPGRLRRQLALAGGWQPWGIDICSGVERAPGVKDREKMRALFEEVRDVEASTVA